MATGLPEPEIRLAPAGKVWKTTAVVCTGVALASAAIHSPGRCGKRVTSRAKSRKGLLNCPMQT